MRVIVYNAEWERYQHEEIPVEPIRLASEFTLQELKFDVLHFNHNSNPPSLDCRTAFHPGGGRQRW